MFSRRDAKTQSTLAVMALSSLSAIPLRLRVFAGDKP